jgi:hypothetical protein
MHYSRKTTQYTNCLEKFFTCDSAFEISHKNLQLYLNRDSFLTVNWTNVQVCPTINPNAHRLLFILNCCW